MNLFNGKRLVDSQAFFFADKKVKQAFNFLA
jgi:hypothetical protein